MKKIAVHLHLYYQQQLDDILKKLNNLASSEYDLYVTLVEENNAVRQQIKAFKSDAYIWVVANLGYDIGPFIDFLHKIDLSQYEYILKLHTKRVINNSYCYFNKRRFSMYTWRQMLLDALLYSPKAIQKNLKIMQENNKIGMLGDYFTLTDNEKDYQNLLANISKEMNKLGLEIPKDKHFFAGSCFLVRAFLFKPLLNYKITDFIPSSSNIHDNTLAHVIERILSWSVLAQGYELYGVHYKNYYFSRFIANFRRFLYQRKQTRSGKQLVKICKVPFYK